MEYDAYYDEECLFRLGVRGRLTPNEVNINQGDINCANEFQQYYSLLLFLSIAWNDETGELALVILFLSPTFAY